MSFHLGKPILVMTIIAIVLGLWTATQPPLHRADLMVWTFADLNADSYREPYLDKPSLIEQFENETGKSSQVDLMLLRALDIRLISLFMSNAKGPRVPDLVETEISNVGKYFRPPPDDIGFYPLNHFLERDGWMNRIVHTRLMAWSKGGQIFMIPHDVHPVTITYRADLYRQAGVDIAASKTWNGFHENCLKFEAYWRSKGFPQRRAMELYLLRSDILNIMLLQRGINLVDDHNGVHFTDPKVAPTVLAYCHMIAGPKRIANDLDGLPSQFVRDLNEGFTCAMITPDWRLGYLHSEGQILAGKIRMMALPKFDPTDAPTGSWGGTGIGIPRNARDPETSWKLLEKLYLSPESLDARSQYANVLSPVMDSWKQPIYQQPDPLLGGQKAMQLYAELARQLPVRYATPYTSTAGKIMDEIVYRVAKRIDDGEEANLESDLQTWLNDAHDDLQWRIKFGSLDQ